MVLCQHVQCTVQCTVTENVQDDAFISFLCYLSLSSAEGANFKHEIAMATPESTENLPPDDERFLIELEFIQNLSNPKYLSYLAQNKYFQDESFMKFLTYLRYFKDPKYLRHLLFPTCLSFLDALIDNSKFRQELLSPVFIEHIHAQQGILISFYISV